MPRIWTWLVPLILALPAGASAQVATVRVGAVLLRPADAAVSVSVREVRAGRTEVTAAAGSGAGRCEAPAPAEAADPLPARSGTSRAGGVQRWVVERGDGSPQRLTLRCARLRTDL